jgi:RHS repeat-associated protein
LLTTKTCWNGDGSSNCTNDPVVSGISEKAVTTIYPGSNGLQSKNNSYYDNPYGLLTSTSQTAWGAGAPGSMLRNTTYTYASLNNGIVDRISSVIVRDGSSGYPTISQTNYTYDEGTPQATSGTPQHITITGHRGNPTTISTLVGGSTWLTRHISYYDTGTVYKTTDVNGAVTTYNYDTTAQGNTTKSCGNSFPTSVTLPITGLGTSTVWDCVGGVATQSTDVNGNSTIATYNDPFWRPASVEDPMPATTNFTYTAALNGNLPSVESWMKFNNNASISEQLSTFDGMGNTLYSQSREGPSSANYDSTQAAYDKLGRAYLSTMPCVANAGQGCPNSPTTTTAYDALGRVTEANDGGGGYVSLSYGQNDVLQTAGPPPTGESLKEKQLEYDALGRLTSVCEYSNGTGSAACGQTTGLNGYLTTYAYSVNGSGNPTTTVTQNALGSTHQTRVYTYDLAGRLISEQNPENGTVQYFYDNDPGSPGASCATVVGSNWHAPYNGDLVKKYDANGNTICYTYDSLHRVTSITYAGTDSANTPVKTFVYDSASYNGTAMANAKGNLAEAYTGPSGSKKTDEFFSYSKRGELTDTWQCTPHSGANGCASVSNYYHVTTLFWENGALKTLSSSIAAVPTQTYGVDSMGRTTSVSASSGTNPVDSTSYDLANFRTTVNFHSGDSDVYTLDPSTGRLSTYQFNVGSNYDKGEMHWNANGTLGSFTITDTVPTTQDTQTCTYGHDEFVRIASVNCVNGSTTKWTQSFTYDVFGNISKASSGPGITFQSQFNLSSNWLTMVSSTTTHSDPNGRLTYDSYHNYTWDAENRMITVDSTSITYDALGRMVEKGLNGTYTEVVYAPQGRFALTNGQTLVKAFVPLPLGATAVYTSSGLAYYRHTDHLGSSRLATTTSRTLYSSTAYAPYGEPYDQAGTTDLSFTGQDQDTVSGIHDFLYRKYMPVQGRWLSPDPAGLGAADPTSPQSWNRYAYVLGSPLGMADPLGFGGCDANGCTAEGKAPCPTGSVYSNGQCVDICPGQGIAFIAGQEACGPSDFLMSLASLWQQIQIGIQIEQSVSMPSLSSNFHPRMPNLALPCDPGSAPSSTSYKDNTVDPASPAIQVFTDCVSSCMGGANFRMTSTSDHHTWPDPHARGLAARGGTVHVS